MALGVSAWMMVLALTGCSATYPVLIKSKPSGAQVYLNEIPIGQTPVAWDFPAIEHNTVALRVEKEGFRPYERMLRADSLSAQPWRTLCWSLLGGVGVVYAPTFEDEYTADLISVGSTDSYPDSPDRVAQPERTHRIGLQYGEHVPPQSGYFHRNAAFFKPYQLNGFLLQFNYHAMITSRVALAIEAGTSFADQEFRSADAEGLLELTRIVLFLSPRYYLFRGVHDLHVYGGAGLFGALKSVQFKMLLPDEKERSEPDVDRNAFGFGGGAGYSYAVTPMVHVTVDVRYTYALTRDVNTLGDDLDIGGFQFVVGPEWRF